jgi:acetyl-CoA synthetase
MSAYTYEELHREVGRAANALKKLGIGRGDRVAIYLPMIPEAAIAMLACARIGAAHSVVFGGFSAESLRDRINDAEAKLLITADGGYRRGGVVPLKSSADEALEREGGCPSIENVLVVRRHGADGETLASAEMREGRDHWWHETVDGADPDCPAEEMDSEDLLYILYTSGTTGKPKGIMHTTGGYMTQVAATTKLVFDLQDDDVYWCTADVGWVTGHSYIVYGPLANGATVVMYEGAPDHPDRGRFWELVEKYRVTIFYTAPTAIRAFMKWGTDFPGARPLLAPAPGYRRRADQPGGVDLVPPAHRRRALPDRRYLVADGDRRDHDHPAPRRDRNGPRLGDPRLSGDPRRHPHAAGGAGRGRRRLPRHPSTRGRRCSAGSGATPSDSGRPTGRSGRGRSSASPATSSRGRASTFPGDGAKRDEDGNFWVIGRIDDVLNVAGHRIGTMEVESALVDHQAVAEAAVVGKAHEVKGQAVAAFVTLKEGHEPSEELKKELMQHVVQKIGAIARPDAILFSADLPKTRSGKIMRRLLKDIAEGRTLGDTTTLADPKVVQKLKSEYEGREG